MTYEPQHDRVLLRDVGENKESEGGILLLDAHKFYRTVEILGISPDLETKLKVGDKCLAQKQGVELEPNVWICSYSVIDCKIT